MPSHYPISLAVTRKSKKKQGLRYSAESIYPLYQNPIEESYNYENIRDSIYHWNYYSPSIGNNWSQMMKLYEAVDKYGTNQQISECTSIIARDIIPYLSTPSMFKKDIYKRLNESLSDHTKSCLNSLVEILDEEIECDRLLNNFDIISKRFDINKLVQNNILFEDSVIDTIYALCELVDTYDIDYRTKFCIAAESALYSVYQTIGNDPIEEEYLSKKLTPVSLLENVFDYFMINYGRTHTEKFLDQMEDVCHKDSFIGEQLDPYIQHIRHIQAKSLVENVMLVESEPNATIRYTDDYLYGMAQDMSQYQKIRESAYQALQEFSIEEIENKAREAIDRMKTAPTQTVGMIKQAIATILVPCRLEDIGKGTHNVLSMLFYALITLGAGISAGAFGLLFGAVFSYIVSKAAQKEYLKDAIQEWRDHKYSVDRKIKDCADVEKKRRMEAYQAQVVLNLQALEKKYEELRDKSISELKAQQDSKKMVSNKPDDTINNMKPSMSNPDVNPQGLITPTSDFYNSKKDHNVKMNDTEESKKKEDDSE